MKKRYIIILFILYVIFLLISNNTLLYLYEELSYLQCATFSMLISLSLIILILFVGFIYDSYKCPTSEITEAKKLGIFLPTYNKFAKTFKEVESSKLNDINAFKHFIHHSSLKGNKTWERFCWYQYQIKDHKALYKIGDQISIFLENENRYVKGEITEFIFRDIWWEYVVVFDERISIKGSPFNNVHFLYSYEIDLIGTRSIVAKVISN